MSQRFKGQIITTGYDWGIQLSFANSPWVFPETATFVAQVRRDPDVEDVLATLTTANNGIKRISDKVIQIRLDGEITADWPNRVVFIDAVRTDGGNQHLGFMLKVPVRRAITRGI
jgi:hypothetical protein